jgi:hypothetical protein
VPIWGFIFVLAAAIVFGVAAWITKSLVALGLCLLAVGIILWAAGAGAPVHL